MPALLERLGVELPIVQAGMAGGLARHELAATVSEAGGLGTIGMTSPGAFENDLREARARTGHRARSWKVIVAEGAVYVEGV